MDLGGLWYDHRNRDFDMYLCVKDCMFLIFLFFLFFFWFSIRFRFLLKVLGLVIRFRYNLWNGCVWMLLKSMVKNRWFCSQIYSRMDMNFQCLGLGWNVVNSSSMLPFSSGESSTLLTPPTKIKLIIFFSEVLISSKIPCWGDSWNHNAAQRSPFYVESSWLPVLKKNIIKILAVWYWWQPITWFNVWSPSLLDLSCTYDTPPSLFYRSWQLWPKLHSNLRWAPFWLILYRKYALYFTHEKSNGAYHTRWNELCAIAKKEGGVWCERLWSSKDRPRTG